MSARYVLGFVFNQTLDSVALILKEHGPATALGWNGIGGQIEPDEHFIRAMTREMFEETGVIVLPETWLLVEELRRDIVVFAAITKAVAFVKSRTAERVLLHRIDKIEPPIAKNVLWLIEKSRARLRSREKGCHSPLLK